MTEGGMGPRSGESSTAPRTVSDDTDAFDLPAVLARLEDPDPAIQRQAVETVAETAGDDPAACVPTVPKLRALLGRQTIDFRDRVIACLADLAAESPADVVPSIDAVVEFATTVDERTPRADAYRCLAMIARERHDAVGEHLDEILADLETDHEEWGLYAIACLSQGDPGAAAPAVPVLTDALATDPDRYGATAAATLGRIAAARPSVPLEFVDDVAALVDHEDPATRNNAIGCLGDVAIHSPAAVEPACPAVADALESDDRTTRVNAAITIARVAAGTSRVAEAAASRLRRRLEDDHPPVRRNACVALANGDVVAARDDIARLAETDPDRGVRERATWALDELSTDERS